MFEKEKKLSYQTCVVTIVTFDKKADIVCASQGVGEDAVNGSFDMWKDDFKNW